jgi:hypothetical protein
MKLHCILELKKDPIQDVGSAQVYLTDLVTMNPRKNPLRKLKRHLQISTKLKVNLEMINWGEQIHFMERISPDPLVSEETKC